MCAVIWAPFVLRQQRAFLHIDRARTTGAGQPRTVAALLASPPPPLQSPCAAAGCVIGGLTVKLCGACLHSIKFFALKHVLKRQISQNTGANPKVKYMPVLYNGIQTKTIKMQNAICLLHPSRLRLDFLFCNFGITYSAFSESGRNAPEADLIVTKKKTKQKNPKSRKFLRTQPFWKCR